MSTYNEEDKRIGYWKLEAFPDHINRRRCKMIRRRGPQRMRMRRDKKTPKKKARRREETE